MHFSYPCSAQSLGSQRSAESLITLRNLNSTRQSDLSGPNSFWYELTTNLGHQPYKKS